MPLIEKRYAEALVDIAIEKSAIDSFREELQLVVNSFSQYEELSRLLLDPRTALYIKKQIIGRIFEGRIAGELLSFLFVLLDNDRLNYIEGILKEFDILADKRLNILNMTIISAVSLEDIQIEKIKEKYRKIYNASSVKAEIKTDSSLIGGVKVVIGDKVIDASVQNMLDSLRNSIIKN